MTQLLARWSKLLFVAVFTLVCLFSPDSQDWSQFLIVEDSFWVVMLSLYFVYDLYYLHKHKASKMERVMDVIILGQLLIVLIFTYKKHLP